MRKFTLSVLALLCVATTSFAEISSELTNKIIFEIGTAATTITPGQWYILNNVGRGNYVSEEAPNWKMRATNTCIVGNTTNDKAGYLFKITESATEGQYYIQSGNGKYFSLGSSSAAVSEVPRDFQIGLIGNSTDIFYIYDTTSGYAADGQGNNGNFLGWSNSIPQDPTSGHARYKLLPVTFADAVTITYTLTDNAGNKYAGSYIGAIGSTPSFPTAYGCTITDAVWDGNHLTANINFPYPVSKIGGATNETTLAMFSNTYLHAIGDDIKAQKTSAAPIDENSLWAIYPSFSDGAFKFAIMNTATGKYIYSSATEGVHDTQGTVVLNDTPSYFTIDSDKDFKFTDKAFYLSINSKNDTNVWLGIWGNAHYGTDISYTNLTQYDVNITDAEYATFYAPVAVSVPEGVTAYYATSENISAANGEYKIRLTAIDNGVIPAYTGVILHSTTAGTHHLPVTENDADAIEGNLLTGSVARTIVGEAAYVLSCPDGGAGLYRAELNENGNSAFVNNHHKAYLPASALSANAAAAHGLRFDWGGTTGIEAIEQAPEAGEQAVYDLTGRRVSKIVAPGIYIINGKKVVK